MCGRPGMTPRTPRIPPDVAEGLRVQDDLRGDVLPHVVGRPGPRDHDARRGGDEQGRDLGDQPLADRQDRERLRRLDRGHLHLEDADDEAADDVDPRDRDAGHGVAADELARAVHGAVEIGFAADVQPAPPRLGLVDHPGVQVRVDRHLLPGHRVEGEPGGDLGDAAGALRDDDEVDHHDDEEHDEADDVVPADDEAAERLDHVARRAGTLGPLEEDELGRRHVQREAEQGRHQEEGREDREIEGPLEVHRDHQDHDGEPDGERQEDVEEERRERDEHDAQQDDHAQGDHGLRALLQELEHVHTALLCREKIWARILATAR